MKNPPPFLCVITALCLASAPAVHSQIAPNELVAPKIGLFGDNLYFTIQPSVSGRNYQLQWSDSMAGGTWQDVGVVRSGDGSNLVISIPYIPGVQKRFYRVALVEAPAAPDGFSLISAGSFEMGQVGIVTPVHTVQLSAFYIAKYEVTKALWEDVQTWGLTHGYTDLGVGSGKASTHPVYTDWYRMVKWCNARSEKENLTPCYYTDVAQTAVYRTGSTDIANTMVKWNAQGYRLPTEAEWEKAARGGLSGKLFPWGDTITHSQANYYSSASDSYDVSPTRGYHPTWSNNNDAKYPYTSPVGSFAPNGYGLYDMAGNVSERCWDRYGGYPSTPQTDPQGPDSGSYRVLRGGQWTITTLSCRVASRAYNYPGSYSDSQGFRLARSSVP